MKSRHDDDTTATLDPQNVDRAPQSKSSRGPTIGKERRPSLEMMSGPTDGDGARRSRAAAGELYQLHPLVENFPRLPAPELAAMADTIKQAGAAVTFLVHRGKVIDDRNRLAACELAGIKVEFEAWDGFDSIAEIVARLNIPRLHLSDSQRAAIAVPITDAISEENFSRRTAGLKRGQENDKTAIAEKSPDSAKMHSRGISLKTRFGGVSQAAGEGGPSTGLGLGDAGAEAGEEQSKKAAETAANLFHVSPRSIFDAKKIRSEAPQLFDEILAGKINLSQAKLQLSKRSRANQLRNVSCDSIKGNRSATGDELIVGDCLKVMPKWKDGSFTLIFADPPYNNGWPYDSDPTGDKRSDADYLAWCEKWMRQCARLLDKNGSLFVLIDDRYSDFFGITLRNIGLHRQPTIVWWEHFPVYTEKKFATAARYLHFFSKSPTKRIWNPDAIRIEGERDRLGDARKTRWGKVPDNVWQIERLVGNDGGRNPFEDAPPELPMELLRRVILAASNPGDRVMDPFTGNAVTWRAAQAAGREFTGIERSELYATQARQLAAGSIRAEKAAS